MGTKVWRSVVDNVVFINLERKRARHGKRRGEGSSEIKTDFQPFDEHLELVLEGLVLLGLKRVSKKR